MSRESYLKAFSPHIGASLTGLRPRLNVDGAARRPPHRDPLSVSIYGKAVSAAAAAAVPVHVPVP